MRNSEATTDVPERALQRVFTALRIGHACLILSALVSLDSVAQETRTPFAAYTRIDLRLAPGDLAPRVSVVPGEPYVVTVVIPAGGISCRWPTMDQLKSRLSGVTHAKLILLESFDPAAFDDLVNAVNVILAPLDATVRGVLRTAGLSTPIVTLGPTETERQVDFGVNTRGCLTHAEARTALLEIRRVVRAYLGLPPPAAPPSATGNIR